MKSNKYWFGKRFLTKIFGTFIPISWEGWLLTFIEVLYLISLSIFQDFYFSYYGLPFALSVAVMVISYYIVGFKKQRPKDKGKAWPPET